ncbi:U-box domain-containing protein 27, partial [Mucuna pruriens]
MVRDDLFITVPSFFRCPISLDVMKSPVSLSTGVTYDRSSIQRWLDNGNNTCPATMQVLQTKDFVPNRTLQRLIQIWSDSVRHRVDSPESPASTESVLSKDQVLVAISDLQTRSDNRFDSLAKIARFAQDSEENRDFLVRTECFVPVLVGFLDNVNGGVEFLEQVVTALDLVISKTEDPEGLKKLILERQSEEPKQSVDSLLLVLQQGSCGSKVASARVLKSVAIDAESKLLIAESEGVVSQLLNLITPEKDLDLIESCLSCLVAISTPKRSKMKLVRLGAVKAFSKLLSARSLSVSVTEKVLKLVETVSSTKEGRSEICEDSACVAAIVNKVLKVSSVATEHAVTTLWSVCYLFRDQKAQEAVTKANGLTKILLLMQSNCSPQVRQMSADLLKIFRVAKSVHKNGTASLVLCCVMYAFMLNNVTVEGNQI